MGKKYTVESSFGHVRDLPKSTLGIDLEKDFEPHYITPRKIQKNITKLKKTAAKAEKVILATDEDREGEAISWHLMEALKLTDFPEKVERIVFHEITKSAIEQALKTPRAIDINLVNAQQARRVLDRLVGYKLSPFLWKKIARGLSAGRVQSVALRLIADREEEINAFIPQEYWTITALLNEKSARKTAPVIEALLSKIDGKALDKFDIKDKKTAHEITEELNKAAYSVASVDRKEVKKNPLPPFITSTLQQESSKRFGFSSKKTMFLAQNLYENGHITYMRTDSVNLSAEALHGAQSWIKDNLPAAYRTAEPQIYKTKSRLAQEAHEAIRPTVASAKTDSLTLERDQKKVYDLIWRRFIASQLPPAVFDATRIDIEARGKKSAYSLFANGNVMKFDGYLKIWTTKFKEKEVPIVAAGATLELQETKPEQHFTEPPPRYNEASLIKILEKFGIGRPSTYAPIISVIQARNYVEKIQGRFHPTEVGTMVHVAMKEHFPEIVDVQFTAKMEEELDSVAEGKERWQKVIGDFYAPFAKHLETKYEAVADKEIMNEETDEKCEKCEKNMIIKFGRFGKFMACSGFPECKTTKTLKSAVKTIGMKCPTCAKNSEGKENPGDVIEKRVRNGRARGKIFWGCSTYPACDYASWTNPMKTSEARPS